MMQTFFRIKTQCWQPWQEIQQSFTNAFKIEFLNNSLSASKQLSRYSPIKSNTNKPNPTQNKLLKIYDISEMYKTDSKRNAQIHIIVIIWVIIVWKAWNLSLIKTVICFVSHTSLYIFQKGQVHLPIPNCLHLRRFIQPQ